MRSGYIEQATIQAKRNLEHGLRERIESLERRIYFLEKLVREVLDNYKKEKE